MEIVDHSSAVGGRVFLLPLVDLLHDDIQAGVAFDGLLPPLNLRNASWTDFPLRDRRSRRLWGNRNGRLNGAPDVSLKSVINGKL